MSFFKSIALACILMGRVLSKPMPQEAPWASVTASAGLSDPTACGDIIDAVNSNYTVFDAESAYGCLSSVPFNAAVAYRFLDYYNDTLQFQSTLAYLRDPPSTYQQPAVDVMQALAQMRQNVTAGYYANQYAFEATLQSVVTAMHDAHVTLTSGILSAFSFGSYYDLMSVSVDGKQLPQVYAKDDVIYSAQQGWTPSPIVSINGEDTVGHLTRAAQLNSIGLLELHADWNALMYSPLQDIQGTYNTYGWELQYYPGLDWNVTFANGTTQNLIYLAFYLNPDQTGPLTTGGDFYNYYVLGLLPASYNETADDSNDNNSNATIPDDSNTIVTMGWNNVTTAFPDNPDVIQPGLTVFGGGFLTGYFLNDTQTAVLSIPSFDEYSDVIGTFSATVTEFITRAKAAGLTRVVIDVQQNFGGRTALAIDTFRQFFPNIEQYVGSRRRSFDVGNVLGNSYTRFWSALPQSNLYDQFYQAYAADEFVVTDRLNAATGKNFTSWSEYAGPLSYYGSDEFSLIERYNFSSVIFAQAALDGYSPSGLAYDPSAASNTPPPWDPSNMILLTDGICSSSCSVFVEMMTHQAGVRTVVAGGNPKIGPMQAASGTRGASSYDADSLDAHFSLLSTINATADRLVPQNRDQPIYTSYMCINLRDQIREGETEPLQFKYLAANCRIYFTLANAYNLTRLWRDAATAIWNDTSLCVPDSTGYASTGNSTAAKSPLANPSAGKSIIPGPSLVKGTLSNHIPLGGLPDHRGPRDAGVITKCSNQCSDSCRPIQCPGGGTASVCLPTCYSIGDRCSGGGRCIAVTSVESKQRSNDNLNLPARTIVQGKCFPSIGTPALGCPAH